MNAARGTAYDQVPYTRKPFAQTHPDHLATLARMRGLRPAPVDRCRVLELGCAAGGNLIPMAGALPGCEFVGLDLSRRQIDDGAAVARELGLRNLDLRCMDIAAADRSLGTFDYVIAHGVYSWVLPAVQEQILRVCRDNLAPGGIAYVSYNTFPGWHFRGMIRDMMLYHTAQFDTPALRIAEARALLDFLAKSTARGDAYGLVLGRELELLRKYSPAYLFHEHLAEANAPAYFHDFAARAAARGLQPLGEAEVRTMWLADLPAAAAGLLRQLTPDPVRREQYADFVRNRAFRQTLLCDAAQRLDAEPAVEPVMELRAACASAPAERADPLAAAAFASLSEAWPRSMPFDALLRAARARLGEAPRSSAAKDLKRRLAAAIAAAYWRGEVKLRSWEPGFVTSVSARPSVSAYARLQAAAGDPVTNQLHESGEVPALTREILRRLDGRTGRDAVIEALARLVEDGKLGAPSRSPALPRGAALRKFLAGALEENLAQLCRNALLTA